MTVRMRLVDDSFGDAFSPANDPLYMGGRRGLAGLAADVALAPKYKIVSGIAKPLDTATLALFKSLQRTLNIPPAGSVLPDGNLTVDGDLGPATLKRAQLFVASSVRLMGYANTLTSVDALARLSAEFLAAIEPMVATVVTAPPAVIQQPTFSPQPASRVAGRVTSAAADRYISGRTASTPATPAAKVFGLPLWAVALGGAAVLGLLYLAFKK